MKRLVLSWLVVLVPLLGAGLEWKDVGEGKLQLLDQGKVALVYNYGPQLPEGVPADRKRSSYIYPAYTPAGVNPLDDFPADHYHHRGIFWGWPVVEAQGKKYDIWMLKGGIENRFEKWVEKRASGKEAILAVENGWYAGGVKLMKESVRMRTLPAKDKARRIEITLTLEALAGPVTLKGSQERGKSYGGLCTRFAPRENTRITADTGVVARDEDLVNHTWAEMEATYAGKRAAVRIDSDPGNPGGAPQWCLRHYGFVGASYPGQSGATLEPNQPLTLKYVVTLRDAE